MSTPAPDRDALASAIERSGGLPAHPSDQVNWSNARMIADAVLTHLADREPLTATPEGAESDEAWEWAATDVTSVELEQWPDLSITRATRKAAEAEFVHDGDDVLLRRRAAGPWQQVDTAPEGGA